MHEGPHNDWGGPEAWLAVNKPDQIHAVAIAEIMQMITPHLSGNPGMMS